MLFKGKNSILYLIARLIFKGSPDILMPVTIPASIDTPGIPKKFSQTTNVPSLRSSKSMVPVTPETGGF